MESEYDRKFEDMKKYIPFLESMIKRLESSSSLSSNPRQAQLDKIRSLRDLLLDKKKRMKMENLLKCEQVLINLYAKVEQRDTLPNTKKTNNPGVSDFSRMENNSQLEIVRNKLKRVSKIHDGDDTLPEIVRASHVEDVCMTGSVEPALFQRRPHKKSPTLSDISSGSQDKPKASELNTKRQYTRILYSPEKDLRNRTANQDTSLDSTLFSRRSPKKSLHSKREGKKASHKTSSKKTKDLNITLNVPEESLNSLNTKDILSRIITCNDNDVDIDTLRGLRTQILGELKQTGANDDISDLILKSYAGKKSSTKVKEEVEEGELSDSESEAIESIYGSLVLVDGDKTKNQVKSVPEKDQPRKIQICLVINSKDNESSSKVASKPNQIITEDLELFSEGSIKVELKSEPIVKEVKLKSTSDVESTSDLATIDDDDSTINAHELPKANTKVMETKNIEDKEISGMVKLSDNFVEKKEAKTNIMDQDEISKKTNDDAVDKNQANVMTKDVISKKTSDKTFEKNEASLTNKVATSKKDTDKLVDKNEASVTNKDLGSIDLLKQNENKSDASVQFKANFYKPLLEDENTVSPSSSDVNKPDKFPSQLEKHKISSIDISSIIDNKNECVQIPLLNEPVISHKPVEKDIDSQIDILQALKNEILGDNILPVPTLDVVTPPLHQPKITKVSHAQEIMPKKRISIEKYKEKTTPVTLNTYMSGGTLASPLRDDNIKKQSLKLTEKECERFNFPTKIDINDDVSSEDEGLKESKLSSDDVYDNFAPKSPDNDDTHFVEKTQPVIIPIDPVKVSVVNFKEDVDMRTLPLLSPTETSVAGNSTASSSSCEKSKETKKNEINLDKFVNIADRNQSPLVDPRMRRDSNQPSKIDNSSLAAMNLDKISNSAAGTNISFVPNMTPSMTPTSRGFDMTPSRLSDFDVVNSSHKHVYAPAFTSLDSRDSKENSLLNEVSSPLRSDIDTGRRKQRWEENNDYDPRSNCSQADVNTQRSRYGDSYKPDKNSGKNNDRSVADKNEDSIRGIGPGTPSPLFGWSEGPSKPNHFGRPEGPVPLMMLNVGRPDCPSTPSHPFGRSDCPPVLGHSFSRLDMPGTPSHPFGRTDCPMTPSHPFGRTDRPTTPIHPFGRSDCPTTPNHPFGRSDVPPMPSPMLGRSDCPTTPSHPFGRTDCPPTPSNPFARIDYPSTPSHPFGMSDCPTTPSHPFGRADCPSTPSHPFGRLECPTTPSHPFGRIDGGLTSNYAYGRTEQSQNISMSQQYSKDPRLNRRSESRSHRDENYKDRGFNTRGSYHMQNRSFSKPESYTHHDREDGERSRSMSRNERNFGQSRSRENYFEQSNSASKGDSYSYDNRSRRRERFTEDVYRREKSFGRSQDSCEKFLPPNSKARSFINDNREEGIDNTVSVKSHAGRSFTIDTSVNSTFQDLLKKKGLEIINQSFDSRKLRAASVGRSLAPCYNTDRISNIDSGDLVTIDSEYRSKNYRRASSVGRDQYEKNESFEKVKTDFKNYQKQIAKKDEKYSCTVNTVSEDNRKSKKYSESQHVNSSYYSTTKKDKQAYTPAKNYRDPRMRREYEDRNSHRFSGHSHDKNKHGINYSSDNLARGVVLGAGYVVKNYKIPKIKRITNKDQKEKTIDEKNEPAETKLKKDESKAIKNTNKKNCSDEGLEGSSEKRLTRSYKREKIVEVSTKRDSVSEIRKSKRPVIYDSSSDSETTNNDPVGGNNLSSDDEKSTKHTECNTNDQSSEESKVICGTDEIFFDNVVSDPVIDNINALIADLDNHIDNSKIESGEDFKDITFDDDLSNISSIENICLSKENTFEELFTKDIDVQNPKTSELHDENHEKENIVSTIDTFSKTVHLNLDLVNSKSPIVFHEANEIDVNKSQDDNLLPPMTDSEKSDLGNVAAATLQNSDENKKTNIDAIVSTTDIDKEIGKTSLEEVPKPIGSDDVNYETSAADSTNEVTSDKTKELNLPDSTNDVHSEMNSLVSSSLSSTDVLSKDFVEPSMPRKDATPALDSIGSILSILQDKSKIHQLLSMIGEQLGDNDKIKRKLEKLSEIVSEDEEVSPDKTVNKEGEVDIKSRDSTLEISNPTADEKTTTQMHSNEEVTDTKIQNLEQATDDLATIEKDAAENVVPEQLFIKNDEESNDNHEVIAVKKGKGSKKGKGKFTKAKKPQRVPRIAAGQVNKSPPSKKPSRELLKLREDIKEMFLTDEMLNTTGIRMCRLAKLVDEKISDKKEETPQDAKPVVVIEKFKDQDNPEESVGTEKLKKKKPSPKAKYKSSASEDLTNEENKVNNTKSKAVTKNVSVPKLKTKASKQEDVDPYEFETDSVDTSTVRASESEVSSDTETNSLVSSKSFGSSEVLADLQKKTKRKRRGKAWQTGIIKPKGKKKKQFKAAETFSDVVSVMVNRKIVIPDNECFIDKFYCFEKNITLYSCRLCEYTGDDIILHYKKHHPHTEIPLSRMNPNIAKEAIEQCQEVNFPAISKISTDRYVCRFCFKEFSKSKAVLESFFWHVVSTHTGEYKQACSECANDTCYFNLDIPPPPKDNIGQLIGYLCGKCNFTQVSLENLKTHVIGRHNDEQTDVYTINLAAMTRKTLKTLAKHQSTIAPRVLRSTRSNQSIGEASDEHNEIADISINKPIQQNEEHILTVKTEKKSYVTSMQAKIAFESEENVITSELDLSDTNNSIKIKQETNDTENTEDPSQLASHIESESEVSKNSEIKMDTNIEIIQSSLPDDVMAHAHFKICYKESGAKEYVCCINGKENHYKTTLLISMKKHVQSKHSERWDGYCVLCKVIVTTQGVHNFRDCLQHFLDKHMDEFPVLEITKACNEDSPNKVSSDVTAETPKSYINVRPLNQLISTPIETEVINDTTLQFPKIQSVVSLGAHVDLPRSSPTYPPILCTETPEQKQYRYEEWQAEVMSKKHRVVLNAMMSEEKLVKVFKCTGRFCSFTTDNAENALLHATTHQRVGGEGALNCSYCDFDASNNGIDLVMHVFKAHGKCPYSCKLCFYRATSSQLVSSHISRLHSERQSFDAILHTTTIAARVTDDDNLLSREEVVPYYVCGHPASEGEADVCKFRTFTPGQFGEHLIRHQPPYPCNMCSASLVSASDLVHHMKTHGLRLYQCTSCVFGADNEPEMLAHASARHPDRLPQAYLRVVTNKDGSTEFRVLPRAFLNKLKAPSRDVITADTDNPVREAERSIALEKLIGHTESVTSIEPVQSNTNDVCDDDIASDTGIVDDSELLLTENIEREPVPPPLSPTLDQPSRKSNPEGTPMEKQLESLNENVSLVVKSEPGVKTPNISESVIYCLDSDEEESRPRVIDISDDDLLTNPTASTNKDQDPIEYKKIQLCKLFKCPNCGNINRNITGLKRHASTCFSNTLGSTNNLQCPHENCNRKLNGIQDIADHYLKDHTGRKITVFACGVCKSKFKTALLMKKHMRDIHKTAKFSVNSQMTHEGDHRVYTIIGAPQGPTLKAKPSSEVPKQKHYWPQDVDQLPINPILESLVYCGLCEFNTKVRLNMVRHLQLHAEQQPVPQTAPVNPVPHLETNERHFDRMVNLASSSILTRAPDKPTRETLPSTPALDINRYPKYVPDRQRYTCGTKNCSYISVDEAMLRIHWETLHSNTNDYLCVHCPPHQHLDQTIPLTAARIIGHLKMHEENLYACSACSYYHFKRIAVEKHLPKCPLPHKNGHIMVVREGGVTPTSTPAPPSSAPTMDLKPWQCGLCSFKSMLRPEVADHCFKVHQSKMQYKCNYCPFRTSAVENVTKHQTNAHPDKSEDVFYFYYREGSIPDDEDGTPRWARQKQKSGIAEPVVKAEIPEPSTSQCPVAPVTPTPVAVNLNLVKQEVEDAETSDAEESIKELSKRFGVFCEPSDTKYKCPLCTAVVEDTAEAMQSHLYEELKYRKWGCSLCSYKAFHKTGLKEHIKSEHHRQFKEPIELPTDVKVEKWVAGLLEYQTTLIELYKQNTKPDEISTESSLDTEFNLKELEQAFGLFGTPQDNLFCCPKCSCTLKDERVMKEHLESELTKIRWCCSNCSFMSHTYHEAQFHCKSVHPGGSACPREAVRCTHRRAAWVTAVLRTQNSIKTTSPKDIADRSTDLSDPNENSLLVVRYEEPVSTSEEGNRRKRSAPVDSDEEKLVIDESEPSIKKKICNKKECPYCDFETKWTHALREHILRHYNLKPFKCIHCEFFGHRSSIQKHFERCHPGQPFRMESTPTPTEPPSILSLPKHNMKKASVVDDVAEKICLHCTKMVLEKDIDNHKHDNIKAEFAKKGDIVFKCCICLVLRLNMSSLQEHHNACHPSVPVNYAYFKLYCDSLECYYCCYCNHRFSYLRDLRSHHRATHSGLLLKYTTTLPNTMDAEEESNAKRKKVDDTMEPNPKRVAKKSTTKLPHNKVAKKSTTKLPYSVSDNLNQTVEEFSYYGKKPTSLDRYANVTTLMPFCNTLVQFTIKKLSEIIKIEPIVLVNDHRK